MRFLSIVHKILWGLGLLALLLSVWVAFLWFSTGPQVPDSPERLARLTDAKAIGLALRTYASHNGNRLPASLEALKPAYLGTNVDVTAFTLHFPSSVLEVPFDHRVVVSETLADPKARLICIYGNGEAALLAPGD